MRRSCSGWRSGLRDGSAEGTEMDIVAAVLGFVARPLVLAAAGMAAIAAARVKSAAGRHAVWTAATVGMLSMGLLVWALPGIPLRIIPVWQRTARVGRVGTGATVHAGAVESASTAERPLWPEAAAGLYGLVVLCFAARLAGSYWFTRRLVAASTRVEDDGTYESTWIAVPVTVGVLRPKIVLPA